jgi:hypothetical protein
MTSDTPIGPSETEKALLARLTRPIPVRVQRELQVCVDMDVFAASLDSTRAAFEAALSRPDEMSRYASPSAVQASWNESLAALKAAFEETDRFGQALIRSIKVMLALE